MASEPVTPQESTRHKMSRVYSHSLDTEPLRPVHEARPTKAHAMAPIDMQPSTSTIRSEPTTPVYATDSIVLEAPDAWYAPVQHREKLAIMTIEHMPQILSQAAKSEAEQSLTRNFSPRLLPLLDRMKFQFSRVMALARHEAENGRFDWSTTSDGANQAEESIQTDDVMSSLHVEVFLAGIQEICLPGRSDRVVFRRYWRLLAPPAGLEQDKMLGGVVSSGSSLEHHVKDSVQQSVDEEWHNLPKVLIAEFEVDHNGFSVAGKMLEDADE